MNNHIILIADIKIGSKKYKKTVYILIVFVNIERVYNKVTIKWIQKKKNLHKKCENI